MDTNSDALINDNLPMSELITPYFSTDFSQFSNLIKKVIFKHFHLVDPEGKIFSRPIISYRRAENFSDLLVNIRRTEINNMNEEHIGQKPCMGNRCLLCKQLAIRSVVSLPDSLFTWTIKNSVNCNSTNCVYLAICKKCNIRYVGETLNFRSRMNLHNSQQFTLPASAFFRHRTATGHVFRDFELIILRSNLRDKDDLRRWERFFIDRLHSLIPNGLNKLEEL
jgi:hypothetical protein